MSELAQFSIKSRNPDVLQCIANLSNDEVFTPPELANKVLDSLEEAWAAKNNGANIWEDKNLKFLDPCTKSGVFLREIAKRLLVGLKPEIPDLQRRVDHILKNMVFGIAITQITGLLSRRTLYCSKLADSQHSITTQFGNSDGNIWFQRTEHIWEKARCKFCGASKSSYERSADQESHAYAFIHAKDIMQQVGDIFGEHMQFDVIIGNPPYQLGSDGGTRDVPVYHKFVDQAKALSPRFIAMVIPSRWMATGLGLTEFRNEMLNDRRMHTIVDFPISKEVFSGVEVKGGVCYFLWDSAHEGVCRHATVRAGETTGPVDRELGEFDVFVRDSRSLKILRKILKENYGSVKSILSSDKEFGWTSNFDGFHAKPVEGDVPIHYVRKGKRLQAFVSRKDVKKSSELIDSWKVMVPSAGSDGSSLPDYVLSKPFVAPSPSTCTQTFLFFRVGSEDEALSLLSYVSTRFFRFLVSLRKITQHATRSTYEWVPLLSWDRHWTDDELFSLFGIDEDEQRHISSLIKLVDWGINSKDG